MTVAVEDASGNVETGDSATTISLAIGTNPSGGTLSGGSGVTVSAGIAHFSGLSINKAGSGYSLTASSVPTYTAATSSFFNITPGAANHLAFVQGPTDAAAGSSITPGVTVAVEDASGNIETGDNATTVSLAIGNNPGRRHTHGWLGRGRGLGRRHLLESLRQQSRYRVHAHGVEHAVLYGSHVGRLHHHGRSTDPPRVRPGPNRCRCRRHRDAGGHGGRRGRQRQHRDG